MKSLLSLPLDTTTENWPAAQIKLAVVPHLLPDIRLCLEAGQLILSGFSYALNAMRFFEHESCGQCTPCRVGTTKAADLMERPTWNTELLEDLARTMEDASICGLGQAAPNPLRCALKYFPQEFE